MTAKTIMKLKGVAMYANTMRPSKLSNKYEIQLTQLDKDTVKELEKAEINIKEDKEKKKDWGKFITPRSNFPVQVYGPELQELSEPIGNGSKVICEVLIDKNRFPGGKGNIARLRRLRVLELVKGGQGLEGLLDDGEDPEVLKKAAEANAQKQQQQDPQDGDDLPF